MSRFAATLAAISIAAFAALQVHRSSGTTATDVAAVLPAADAPVAAPAPPVAQRTCEPIPKPPVDASSQPSPGYIAYPDGTFLPPLNGVTEAPPMSFSQGSPFTKVTGKHRDDAGRDWYQHENGALSTTFFDGRGVAFSCIMMPLPKLPVE